jgi:hypothetical protein
MDLLRNRILLAVLLAWFATQLIKAVIGFYRKKKLSLGMIFETGGMPSSHSSTVSALATAVLLTEGVSTSFIVSLVLAFIVIRDALGVREEVQKHAMLLRKISNEKISEDVGHTFSQVLVGVIIGVVVASIII